MRCTNCGLPLSPARAQSTCPRCGVAVNSGQEVEQLPFDQPAWGAMGTTPQQYNPWGQQTSTPPYQQWPQNQAGIMPGQFDGAPVPGTLRSGFPQSPMPPRRPAPPPRRKTSTGLKVALVGLIAATVVLGLIAVLGLTRLGKPSSNSPSANATTATTNQQASTSPTATSAPSATVSASVTPTGTAYPGQQYIDSAQMTTGPDATTQPTTSFIVGSKMYVTFNVHPPSQGGDICAYWFLNGTQIVKTTPISISPSRHSSNTWAVYDSAGSAYVELYWASDATCADQVLAQHVEFTVTNS